MCGFCEEVVGTVDSGLVGLHKKEVIPAEPGHR